MSSANSTFTPMEPWIPLNKRPKKEPKPRPEFVPKPFKPGSIVTVEGVDYDVLSDAPAGVWALPVGVPWSNDRIALLGRPGKTNPDGWVKGFPLHTLAPPHSGPLIPLCERIRVADAVRAGVITAYRRLFDNGDYGPPTLHTERHRTAGLAGEIEDYPLSGKRREKAARDIVYKGEPTPQWWVLHTCTCLSYDDL